MVVYESRCFWNSLNSFTPKSQLDLSPKLSWLLYLGQYITSNRTSGSVSDKRAARTCMSEIGIV